MQMVKISERFINWIKSKYDKKGLKWERSDEIVWGFWANIAPIIIWIPILFWILKYTFIDFMYKKYGFEKTIIFIAIIMFIKPLIFELFTKLSQLRNKQSEEEEK